MLCTVSFWNGVYPFGPESFLTEDLKYQYIDFFTWFQSVLQGERSLFYSNSQALGANTWGLFSYYLASPFNLLIVFFDEMHFTDFAFLITALKLGSVGVTSTWYMRKRFDLRPCFALMLALCYTWSLWTITQMRNPMWLDGLILLPLVLYGVYAFVHHTKWKMLVVSVCLTIITCWYIAYMIILFSCLFFCLELVLLQASNDKNQERAMRTSFVHKEIEELPLSAKQVLKRIALFAGLLMVCLLLCSFTFIPTVVAMLDGSDASNVAAYPDSTYYPIKILFANLFLGNWAINDTPQLFCGTIVIFLVVLFFCTRSISWQKKVSVCLLLIFMVASAWIVALDYVWCGFRQANGFYCRTTFLTCFLFTYTAAFALKQIQDHKISPKALVASLCLLCLFALLVRLTGGFFSLRYLAVTLFVAGFAFACFLLYRHFARDALKKNLSVLLCGLLLLCTVGELVYCAHGAWQVLYRDYSQEYHDTYVADSREQTEELRNHDDSLYRLEKTYTRAHSAALNEGMARDFMQLSSYSSAHDVAAVNFLSRLGYNNEGEVSVHYTAPILLSDALLGVKYVSADTLPAGFKDEGLSTTRDGNTFYRNPLSLSIGYEVSEAILETEFDEGSNPFEFQNTFMNGIFNDEEVYYTRAESTVVIDKAARKQWEVSVPEQSIGYVYQTEADYYSLLIIDSNSPLFRNWRFEHNVEPITNDIGNAATHSVAIEGPSYASDPTAAFEIEPECIFYSLDVQKSEAALAKLAENQFTPAVFKDGYIEGTYTANDDSLLLLTIPNARGWTIEVNGTEIQAFDVFEGALMAIPVNAGHNSILMTYQTPALLIGCSVTIITVVLMSGLLIWKKKRGNSGHAKRI